MWTDLVAWLQSPAGARVLQTAVIPALAIIVAGIIAALIGRAAVRSMLARADREQAATVVSGLVEAARATADPGPADKDRRRAARIRSEMDVRTRLLPLKNADVAADWASSRISGLEQTAPEALSGELDAFRDRLVAWTRTPKKAKSLFATPRTKPSNSPKRRSTAEPVPAAASAPREQQPEQAQRPTVAAPAETAAAPSAPAPQPAPAAAPTAPEEPAAGAVRDAEPSTASVAVAATPAWRRARAAADARSEQEPAPTTDQTDQPEAPLSTAPVAVQHQHRAAGAPATDADDAVRLEAQQLAARHARAAEARATESRSPVEQQPQAQPTQAPPTLVQPVQPQPAAAAAQEAAPEPAPEPVREPARAAAPAAGARVLPAWLDTYDDEADVTQNLNLKTPPPVAAAAVRDRTRSGEDIVPRE